MSQAINSEPQSETLVIPWSDRLTALLQRNITQPVELDEAAHFVAGWSIAQPFLTFCESLVALGKETEAVFLSDGGKILVTKPNMGESGLISGKYTSKATKVAQVILRMHNHPPEKRGEITLTFPHLSKSDFFSLLHPSDLLMSKEYAIATVSLDCITVVMATKGTLTLLQQMSNRIIAENSGASSAGIDNLMYQTFDQAVKTKLTHTPVSNSPTARLEINRQLCELFQLLMITIDNQSGLVSVQSPE